MIGVLVSGEGTNLQALIDAGLPIRAVASSKAGVPALERARRAAIPAAAFQDEGELADWLEERGVRLVVLAGYMRILSPSFLERFDPIVNVHPSLLPAFPGLHAIEQALEAGVDTTGVTVHLVDEGIDTGPLLRQEPVPVEPRETLTERIHAVEHRLLPEVVRGLISEEPSPSVSSGVAGQGGKGAARRTVRIGTAKRRPRSIPPPAASGGGEAGRRPARADADEGSEGLCARC